MKFVLLTYDGHGLPIAYKMLLEGNDVLVCHIESLEDLGIKETPEQKEKRMRLYDGMLEKMPWEKLYDLLSKEKNKEDYFIFSDFSHNFKYAQELKKLRYWGLLPEQEDYELEADRNKAKKLVHSKIPLISKMEVNEFSDVEDAIDFLKKTDKLWVLKGNNPEAETYVPFTDDITIAKEEIINILKEGKKIYESEGFTLEEKISDLVEFIPEIVVSDGEVLGMSIDLEVKPIGCGNVGFQTGCAADFMFVPDREFQQWLFENFFEPLRYYWDKPNKMTIWDVGIMYSPSKNKFYFSEFCSNRPGYNFEFTKLTTFSSVTEYFEKIRNKQQLWEDDKPKAVSTRIFNLLRDPKTNMVMDDLTILTEYDHPFVWLWDVYKKEGKLKTCGYDFNTAVVTYTNWMPNLTLFVEFFNKIANPPLKRTYQMFKVLLQSRYTENNLKKEIEKLLGEDWRTEIEDLFENCDKMISEEHLVLFPDMYYRRWFDLIRADYKNSIVGRYKFIMENKKKWIETF